MVRNYPANGSVFISRYGEEHGSPNWQANIV